MKRPVIPALILSIAATLFAADYINKSILTGAKTRAENVDLDYTLKAQNEPEKFYWENYPYSLAAASIGGLIIFVITYFLSPKRKKEIVSHYSIRTRKET